MDETMLKINFHISYDENLTMQDFEDIINFVRVSNNDALEENGISRPKGNGSQRIGAIKPGSINFETIIATAGILISGVDLVIKIIDKMKKKVDMSNERNCEDNKKGKKVYNKNKIYIDAENVYSNNVNIDNAININIYIKNGEKE